MSTQDHQGGLAKDRQQTQLGQPLSSAERAVKEETKNNMLKALLLLLTNLAIAAIATAQNLVPNPSFEDTTYCDVYDPIIKTALHWYNVNTATPDIWDCDTVRRCGNHIMDPNDTGVLLTGYLPSFDGLRHAGCYQWYGPDGSSTREYLMAELLSDLQAGQSYRASLYCARPKGFRRAIDRIGIYFSPDSIFEPYPTTLPFVPQAELVDPNNTYLVDTNWVQVMDTFIAAGNERWLLFGTFLDDADVNGIDIPPLVPLDKAYYYIDLVSVVPLYSEAVNEHAAESPLLLANAAQITWRGSRRLDVLIVYDSSGRLVLRPEFSHGTGDMTVPIPAWLVAGAYVVEGWADGTRYGAKFVK